MIADGYSRHIRLAAGKETLNVIYRPATANERTAFFHSLRRLSVPTGNIATFEWVMQHVVRSDVAIWPGEPVWAPPQRLNEKHPAAFDRLFKAIRGVIPDSSGLCWAQEEPVMRRNLYEGVLLERTNPRIAHRSCVDCKALWYSEKTGLPIIENSTGKPMLRDGPTLCETIAGCPKGTPEKQKSLSVANRWALKFHLECIAVKQFPADQIVRESAVLIERALATKVK